MTKDELRNIMRTRRRELNKDFIETSSKSITEKACSYIGIQDTVMVYMSTFKEPDTLDIIKYLKDNNIKIVIPISNTATQTLSLSYISGVDALREGAYGILEPAFPIEAKPEEIDIALIPGIAFSKKGDRLGFGKGYYDKFLAEFSGKKVGICYDFQVFDEIPSSAHDIKMDTIITERWIYSDF